MYKSYSHKHAIIMHYNQSWQKYRQACKKKREDNTVKSLKILTDANIPYTLNSDKSVSIDSSKGNVTFHPATGTFYGAYEGRGVFNLIQKIL